MYEAGTTNPSRAPGFTPGFLWQELLTLIEHLGSPLVISGVHVARSLDFVYCFLDHCLSFCPISLGHCIVCPSEIYDF